MHELKQPLNVIKIICQPLQRSIMRGELNPADLPAELGEIVAHVGNIAAIADQVHLFILPTVGDTRKTIALRTVVDEAVKFHRTRLRSNGIGLVEDHADDPSTVWADALCIEEIGLNLVSNAALALETVVGREKRITLRTLARPGEAGSVGRDG